MAESGLLPLLQVLHWAKTVGFIFRFNVRVRLLLTRYKSVRVIALTGSVPCKMAEGSRFKQSSKFQHPAGVEQIT